MAPTQFVGQCPTIWKAQIRRCGGRYAAVGLCLVVSQNNGLAALDYSYFNPASCCLISASSSRD